MARKKASIGEAEDLVRKGRVKLKGVEKLRLRIEQGAEEADRVIEVVEKEGSLLKKIQDGLIQREELQRFLSRGAFSERLEEAKDALAADLFSTAYTMAQMGNKEMLQFLMPAVSKSLDPSVRKEEARAKGLAANQILAKLLEDDGNGETED